MCAPLINSCRSAVAWLVLVIYSHGVVAVVEYDPALRIESAHLYGNVAEFGYYFVDLLIGSPEPQRASVIVDTGSRLVGFPCRGCDHCGEHLDDAFDVSRSLSARWITCESQDCASGCFEDHCAYAETYSEGSSISGFWFDDLVEIGDSLQKNPPVMARLGCHMNENELFYTQRANGIMGLAPGGAGDDTSPIILRHLFHDKEHVDTRIFSLCLATWGGRLTVGGYNSSYHKKKNTDDEGIQWIRLRPAHYHFVYPVGVTLGETEGLAKRDAVVIWGSHNLGITIIDSGTTYTYFPGPLYNAILQKIRLFCLGHDGCGADASSSLSAEGAECWQVNDAARGPAGFPTLHLYFDEDTRIDWTPGEYLQQRDEAGMWCQTFLENSIFQTVLGISFMLHKDLVFDVGGGRLGIAEANCPEHHQPPVEPPLQQELLVDDYAAEDAPRLAIQKFSRPSGPVLIRGAAVAAEMPAALCAMAMLGLVAMLGATWLRSRRRSPARHAEEVQDEGEEVEEEVQQEEEEAFFRGGVAAAASALTGSSSIIELSGVEVLQR